MLAIKPKYLKKTSSTDPRRAIIWLIQVLKIIVDQFLKIFLLKQQQQKQSFSIKQ